MLTEQNVLEYATAGMKNVISNFLHVFVAVCSNFYQNLVFIFLAFVFLVKVSVHYEVLKIVKIIVIFGVWNKTRVLHMLASMQGVCKTFCIFNLWFILAFGSMYNEQRTCNVQQANAHLGRFGRKTLDSQITKSTSLYALSFVWLCAVSSSVKQPF